MACNAKSGSGGPVLCKKWVALVSGAINGGRFHTLIVVVMLSVREVESGPLSELVVSVLQIAAVTHALWLPFELTLHSLSSISMGLGAVPDSTFVMETASTNAGRVRPPPAKAAMGGSAFKLHRSVFCQNPAAT